MAGPATGAISSTLQRVLDEHVEPCEAGAVVTTILGLHDDYARGRAKAIGASVFRPAQSRLAPVATWYEEARQLLIPDLGELSGRTAIVGLALADLAMGREMVRSGLFTCIIDELKEGRGVLSARGLRRLAQIPRATLCEDTTPIVLAAEGPLVRGGISSNGSRVVAHDDHQPDIRLWNVESGLPLGWLGVPKPPRPVRMVRFSPDGATILALMRDGSVMRWPVTSFGDPPVEVSKRIDGVASGALAADASCAVKRLMPSGFNVLDMATGTRVDVDTDGQATRICVSPDGGLIALAIGRKVEVHRRSAADVERIAGYDLEHDVRALECGGGVVVAVVGDRVHVEIVNREPDVPRLAVRPIEVRRPTRVAVANDGSLCAVVGAEGVTVLEPLTGTVLGTLTAAVPAIRGMFSLDNERLLVQHEDGSMRVWDVGLRPSGVRPPPARFNSDRADGMDDYLGRMHDVEAIASLIAATSVEPPLSIGIFGNWGSGKSWFMEQLWRKVSTISADAFASRVPQREVSFFKRIAQVRFNAWHYAEADVLSSLVEHVFRRLDLGDRGDNTYTETKKEAQEKLARASKEEIKAQSVLGEAEQELAEITERRKAAEAIRESKAEQFRHDAESDDIVRRAATSALESVGWKGTGGAAAELVGAIRENRRELERANVVLGPLVLGNEKEISTRRRHAFVCAAIGPVLAIVIGAMVAVWGDEATAALASAGALLAGVLTGATKLVHDHTTFIRRSIDALTEAELRIEEHVTTQLQELDGQIQTEKKAEIAKRQEVETKRQDLVAKQTTVVSEATALARLTPEQMLEDLVDARIASGDYARQLGIIALARSDIEKVSNLIEAGNQDLLGKSSTERLDDESGVNRIVLYIDDLDRCEPAKVAKVLQAVHLLLAFPLFVVVVAVDPRWVGRALEKEYPELLDGGAVDPNEYLEKVFQIPFWLDQLDTTRTAAMLQGLAQVSPRAVRNEHRARATSSATGRPDRAEGETGEVEGTGETGPDVKVDTTQAARSRDLNPPALAMESNELEAMQELAPVLGTSPRALKRFVNIYRLFKVRAEDPVDFADEERVNPDYQVVLYLLAQITGDPAPTDELFTSIRDAEDDRVLDLPGLPEGWPSTAAPYKRWLDEVSRFSFRALLPAVGQPSRPVLGTETTPGPGTPPTDARRVGRVRAARAT